MPKVYKTEIYFTDYNDEYSNSEHFKSELSEFLQRLWVGVKIENVVESKDFKWDDDLDINKVYATKDDFEKYFKTN